MTEKDIEFLQRWLKLMDIVCPETRGKVNAASIRMTDKFLAVRQDDQIEVATVEK